MDPSDPHGKRPVGIKKSKKKKKPSPVMGTLATASRTRIPVPLTNEEEQMQLTKTLQRSMVEKRASSVSYLEGVGPS